MSNSFQELNPTSEIQQTVTTNKKVTCWPDSSCQGNSTTKLKTKTEWRLFRGGGFYWDIWTMEWQKIRIHFFHVARVQGNILPKKALQFCRMKAKYSRWLMPSKSYCTKIGDCSFALAAHIHVPTLWNELPREIRHAISILTFKKLLEA